MNIKQLIVLLIFICIAWQCDIKDFSNDNEIIKDTLTPPIDSNEREISGQIVEHIIQSIPSPLEITTIVKGSGKYFTKEMLNNPANIDNYSTNSRKALNLGIYSTDLGCINIYGKTNLIFGYLDVVRTLTNEFKVGQFFDFNTLKRLAGNAKNIDSIIFITTYGYEKMNNYLTERKRSNISILILVGGWLEALHLATYITSTDNIDIYFKEHPELVERIGEQKIVLDDIMLLLSFYYKRPGFNDLINDLKELQEIYKEVKITYTYEEPELQEFEDVLIIIDKSSSVIEISPEILEKIILKVAFIRNKIVL